MAQFLIPHIEYLVTQGYEIEIACSPVQGFVEEVRARLAGIAIVHIVNLARSPYNLSNGKGFLELKQIIEKGEFDFIWTNEPVMGVLTRLAAVKKRKRGCKVIYFAHGFHFFEGASISRWLIFYPVEKIMAYFTDVIVTINQEDYERAKRCFHKKVKIFKFPGVGINLEKFKKHNIDISKKRQELEVPEKAVVFLSVGELEKRKNHALTIKAFELLDTEEAYLLICGKGTQEKELRQLIECNKKRDRIRLLGYRTDISEMCEMADVFVFSSFQEGLSVALMEAMSNEIVCAVSNIRGNVDLIGKTEGFLFNPQSVAECCNALRNALESKNDWERMKQCNKAFVQQFDFHNVKEQMLTVLKSME